MNMEFEWRILSYHIHIGNVSGLDLMNRSWFSGLARSVYDIVKRARARISVSYVLEMLSDELEANDVEEVRVILNVPMNDTEKTVIEMMHALSFRFASSKIKSEIRRADFRIGDNEPIFRIKSDLMLGLEEAYELAPDKSIEAHLEEMRRSSPRYIKMPGPRFAQAGLDVIFMGNIMTMGGESGGYKTTGVVNLMRWLLKENPDLHAIYFSKEQPAAEIAQKFITLETPEEITYSDVLRRFNATYPDFCEQCLNEMAATSYHTRLQIVDPTEFATPEDIALILRSYSAGKKEVVWAVDYLTLLTFPGRENMTVNISNGLKILKTLAHQTKSIGILVSQLLKGWNIDPRTKQANPYLYPDRATLLWSSELINLSGYIIMLKRLMRKTGTNQFAATNYLTWRFEKLRFADANALLNWNVDGEQQRFNTPSNDDFQEIQTIMKEMIF